MDVRSEIQDVSMENMSFEVGLKSCTVVGSMPHCVQRIPLLQPSEVPRC